MGSSELGFARVRFSAHRGVAMARDREQGGGSSPGAHPDLQHDLTRAVTDFTRCWYECGRDLVVFPYFQARRPPSCDGYFDAGCGYEGEDLSCGFSEQRREFRDGQGTLPARCAATRPAWPRQRTLRERHLCVLPNRRCGYGADGTRPARSGRRRWPCLERLRGLALETKRAGMRARGRVEWARRASGTARASGSAAAYA
jgi:hypothetical protein